VITISHVGGVSPYEDGISFGPGQYYDCFAFPSGDEASISFALDKYAIYSYCKLANFCSTISLVGGVERVAKRLCEIVEHLGAIYATTDPTLFRDPCLLVWISRGTELLKACLAAEGEARKNEIRRLEVHAGFLPLIVIGFLNKQCPGLLEGYDVSIPTDTCYNPIGLRWQLRGRADLPLSLRITLGKGFIRLLRNDLQVAEIPDQELLSQATGGSIRVLEKELISVSQRSFAARGSIEVVPAIDFPELYVHSISQRPIKDWELDINAEVVNYLSVLEAIWLEGFLDVKYFCRVITPVITLNNMWKSNTDPSVPFIQKLTFFARADPLLAAEQTLHESSHTKLDILNSLDPILENDGAKIYRHPWRPDLRPMSGVLFGAHAFLAVMELYGRAMDSGLRDEWVIVTFLKRVQEVGRALETLEKHGSFTRSGRVCMNRMVKVFEDRSKLN
jgi:hypothetical protein